MYITGDDMSLVHHCNKGTAVVGEADDTGGCACVGQEAYGKCLCLLINFAVNLKLL